MKKHYSGWGIRLRWWSRNDLTIDGWQLVGGVVIVAHCLWLVVVNLVGGDCCVWWR